MLTKKLCTLPVTNFKLQEVTESTCKLPQVKGVAKMSGRVECTKWLRVCSGPNGDPLARKLASMRHLGWLRSWVNLVMRL